MTSLDYQSIDVTAAAIASFLILFVVTGYLFLQSAVLMLAWNLFVAGALSGPAISFWQAFGLGLIINSIGAIFSLNSKRS